MTDRMRESLSALMDDEANELELQRLLSQIGEDEELRQTWVRYNDARGALGGQAQSFIGVDISRRVSEAVAAESTGASTPLRERLMRPVASFAVAASVAATVVIGGQQLAQLNGADPYEQGVVAGVSPVGMVHSVGATPVRASFGTEPLPVLQPTTGTAYQELARQRMQMYIQEHAEHAALNSPHGLIPFARVPQIEE